MSTLKAMAAGDIVVMHGPNLNLLGSREPHVYGTTTLADIDAQLAAAAKAAGVGLRSLQTNSLAELVDAVHGAAGARGILVNPGAFTHFAWSLHDALAAVKVPAVEVHISNPAAREPWRHVSVLAPVVVGTVAGFGAASYLVAFDALMRHLSAARG